MQTTQKGKLALCGVLSSLCLSACSIDVPDLNDPGLDELEEHPTAVSIAGACTGLLIGNRFDKGQANGYVSQLGILGRESYNFDTADPRYVSEMLAGTLSQGSPFGGAFWAIPYGNIRLANVILHALDKVNSTELSDTKKAAIRGFVNTIMALDLLEVIVTHDTNGAVIDTDQPIVLPPAPQPLGAIVGKGETYAKIISLLDSAASDLDTAEAADMDADFPFPFALSSGFEGFDTAASFKTFNRAIKARVATYTKDYAGVLDALGNSFLDVVDPIDFDAGVYYVYSTKTGDLANGLINPNLYAHPSIETDAQTKLDPDTKEVTIDLRFGRKITRTDEPGSVTDTPLMSSLQFGKLYSSPDSPLPLIRNEELILLKAEALFFTGKWEEAVAALNVVRTQSGGLDPRGHTTAPSEAAFVDELLYERRYSLLFEGGHRWIDTRRFARTQSLALDDPSYKRNIRYPIPLAECNARPGEPACQLGSL